MTVKDIALMTATRLGREDVYKYFSSEEASACPETLRAADVMIRLINLVVGELAFSYIPMIKTERALGGKIKISDLKENAVEILDVKDEYGFFAEFTVKGENILTVNSPVDVVYRYLPAAYGADDEIGYGEKQISAETISCGVAAEFAVSEGDFEQAAAWRKRFSDDVNVIVRPKNGRAKGRAWI